MKCRVCKQEIKKEDDWIMPSQNYYYHSECYEKWKTSSPKNDDEYVSLIYDFISHTLKKKYNYFTCEAQRKKFVSQGMTNKGIFFALKYFYEIKKGDWEKGHGSIGIVAYVYEESKNYWREQERRTHGVLEAIAAQQKRISTEVTLVKPQNRKEKKQYSLTDILESEDDV